VILASIVFFLLLAFGVPVAFVMLGASVFYFVENPMMASIVAQRMSSSLESFPLLAVPFFVFAGAAMARGGIADRLYGLAEAMVGHWRGGLAQVGVLNSLFIGAMSGSANADAAIDARSLVPIMRKQGYSNGFGSAISVVSGVIAPLLPPSIGLIIYGLLTDTSIGRLFLGGIVPAVLCTLVLMATVRYLAVRRNYGSSRTTRMKAPEITSRFRAALWALAMPVMLIFGLRGGWFTPTELGAMAALYALTVGLFVYRGFGVTDVYGLLRESAYTTASVMFIVAAAGVLGIILALEQVPQRIVEALLTLSDNKYVVLSIIMLALLVLGTILEGIALLVILAPLLLQVATKIGVDPVHFGILIVFNTTIASISPPVGTVIYTVCSITKCTLEDLTVEMLPFMLALTIFLFVLVFCPPLVTFLPNMLF
jgi:tripartite ATP-independent transporter DctM subunit